MAMKRPIKVAELFDGDSSDEDDVDKQQKRQRGAGVAAPGGVDPRVAEMADKLAAYVAKNGRQYEDMTRQRNSATSAFGFLHDKSSAGYAYYEAQLQRLTPATAAAGAEAASGQAAPDGSGAGRSGAGRSRWDAPAPAPPPPPAVPGPLAGASSGGRRFSEAPPAPPAAAPPPTTSTSGRRFSEGPPPAKAAPAFTERAAPPPAPAPAPPPPQQSRQTPAAGAAPGSRVGATLSAMDAYMAALKRKEEEDAARRAEAAEEEERRRRAPHLKETAFDRRKVVAVFKEDGTRGHHMQDYIPPEELAKMMAKSDDPAAQAAAEQLANRNAIGADNIGHKLLQKMGWKEGQGIGAGGNGTATPVAAGAAADAGDKLGLGATPHGAIEDGDDAFEQYRKRMMLGYKYRPNPLGNPRRQYY